MTKKTETRRILEKDATDQMDAAFCETPHFHNIGA
tara:strand:+ start:181398 stop:181502 length:105 start_codon:yes stop_codon:yes gene_type:complete